MEEKRSEATGLRCFGLERQMSEAGEGSPTCSHQPVLLPSCGTGSIPRQSDGRTRRINIQAGSLAAVSKRAIKELRFEHRQPVTGGEEGRRQGTRRRAGTGEAHGIN